ncbi:hypothetical protein V6N13_106765 [Hibiscus sabdariffa]
MDELTNNGVNGAADVRSSYTRMATSLPQHDSDRLNLNIGENQDNSKSTQEVVRIPSFSSKGADLFGPWTVVKNRRRQTKPSNVTSQSGGVNECGKVSTRFEVLEVEETIVVADENNDPRGKLPLTHVQQASITRNATYMASNLEKKKKKVMKKTFDSIVLPSVPGQRITVFDREAGSSKGLHRVVSIVEYDARNKKAVGVNLSKPQGGHSQAFKDKVHKGDNIPGQNRVTVIGLDWVQETTDQPDTLREPTVQHGRDTHSVIHSWIEDPPDSEGVILDDEDLIEGSDLDGVDETNERTIVQ